MRFAITGSNGYVGGAIKKYFEARGHTCLELCRRKSFSSSGEQPLEYQLGDKPNDPRLAGCDALIHCAYDFSVTSWAEINRVNVLGTQHLFEAAKSAGIRKIVLISSISAFETSSSLYGRAKLEMENIATRSNAIIVRPGLVWGDSPGGMVGTLSRLVEKLPIVPEIGGSQEMFLVHQDDLCALIDKSLHERGTEGKPLLACNSKCIRFADILRLIAKKQGHSRLFLPIPWRCAWLGLRTLELTGVQLGIRSDSLISLMNPNPEPDFGETSRLGIGFRSFESAGA